MPTSPSRRQQGKGLYRSLQLEVLESRRVLATGLLVNNEAEAFDGYTLFSPQTTRRTLLVDNDGTIVNEWQSDSFRPGLMAYLLPDGRLLRSGVVPANAGGNGSINGNGAGGRIELFDWDGNVLWTFRYDNASRLAHHDIEVIHQPDGSFNILVMAWESRSNAEALQAGRNPNKLAPQPIFPETIIEVKPNLETGGSEIVWKWDSWDHLVQVHSSTRDNWAGNTGVRDNPQLINVNYGTTTLPGAGSNTPADFMHANGIAYHPEYDLIVLSVREYNEFWVIDHSTTTEEAKTSSGGNFGMGGDIIFRWGNPEAHGGSRADRRLFWQHDAQWVIDGDPTTPDNILVFNNGTGRPDGNGGTVNFTTVLEVEVPLPNFDDGVPTSFTFDDANYPGPAPSDIVFSYRAPDSHYAPIISGTQRLPNGNTLSVSGTAGNIVEVNPDGEIVWRYVNPLTGNGPLGRNQTPPQAFPGALPALRANFLFKARKYGFDYFEFHENFTPEDLEPVFRDTIGLVDPASWRWWLDNVNGESVADVTAFQTPSAPSNWQVIAGDWNGDGFDTIGLFDPRNDRWWLNNKTDGSTDDMLVFQTPSAPDSWVAVAGDWDGDGIDSIGLYNRRTNTWYLNNNLDGSTDGLMVVSTPGPRVRSTWRPIVGDWDGDGADSIGLYNPATEWWFLNNKINGETDDVIAFKTPSAPNNWLAIAGDWNDDGLDTVGLYDPIGNRWYLNDETDGTIDTLRRFRTPARSSFRPIAGNWNRSGIFADPLAPPPESEAEGEAAYSQYFVAPTAFAPMTSPVAVAPSAVSNASAVDSVFDDSEADSFVGPLPANLTTRSNALDLEFVGPMPTTTEDEDSEFDADAALAGPDDFWNDEL